MSYVQNNRVVRCNVAYSFDPEGTPPGSPITSSWPWSIRWLRVLSGLRPRNGRQSSLQSTKFGLTRRYVPQRAIVLDVEEVLAAVASDICWERVRIRNVEHHAKLCEFGQAARGQLGK